MTLLPEPGVDQTNWESLGQIRWESLSKYFNATNWQNYIAADDGTWGPAEIGKDAIGFVHLRGLIKSVAGYNFATASTLIIATLPPYLVPQRSKTHMGLFQQVDTAGGINLVRLDIDALAKQIKLTNVSFATSGSNNGIVTYARMLIDPWYAPQSS